MDNRPGWNSSAAITSAAPAADRSKKLERFRMQTHSGSCHCGNVSFEFESEILSALRCNCSFCARRGALLHQVPPEQFRIVKGDVGTPNGAETYGSGIFLHHFCPSCGIQCFTMREGRGKYATRMVHLNLNCVDGVDTVNLSVRDFDGAAMPEDNTTWE